MIKDPIQPGFNLILDPWILVQRCDGTSAEVSIKELFEHGYDIKRLAHEDPLIDTSVLAILVAVFNRAILHDFDKQWEEDDSFTPPEKDAAIKTWIQKNFQPNTANLEPILDYLESADVKNRFDLFHPEHPFMQVANLHTSKNTRSEVSRIIFDSESDHFSIRADKGKKTLSFAEAACYLIATHAYDYSGIKSGAVGDPRIKGGKGYPIGTGWYGSTDKVILHGKNIIETLLLNTPYDELFEVSDDADGYSTLTALADQPVWERTPDTAAQREDSRETVLPTGSSDILTWQSRRIRLFPEGKAVTGVLVSNGDKVSDKFVEAKNLFDPWTGYRYSKNQSSKTEDVWMPQQHNAERTLWKGIDALLTLSSGSAGVKENIRPRTVTNLGRYFPQDIHLTVQLVGVVYGPQNSVIEAVIDEHLPLELALLTENHPKIRAAIIENSSKTVNAAVQLGRFAGHILVAAGKEYEFQPQPTENALYLLETEFRNWLSTVTHHMRPEEVKALWHQQAQKFFTQEAQRMLAAAPPKAVLGRLEDENGIQHLVTAATAHRSYLKSLRETFPLAYPDIRKENTNG
ncbi:type I-E CRISPR-associated protein Cse1/CasA [Rothia sp. ZJ932]|uniref:type I-E CRISPR-associated protein Cse1/CasA n=1 Tax=Rothia sp. ZJ932 TaxID=2810516 RepID=UPI0019679699|nr:type I-E CRISPR-associated protein Cse1/CasA [Rothia sp. ZJ932]QRZ61430.1 type I-E CRISPR-associated protein Cse1/CasA [Rothia sp. ZJ932]